MDRTLTWHECAAIAHEAGGRLATTEELKREGVQVRPRMHARAAVSLSAYAHADPLARSEVMVLMLGLRRCQN